jgi:hypothetical protein
MLVVAHHTPTASKAMSQYEAMIDLRTRAVSNGRGDGMRRLGAFPSSPSSSVLSVTLALCTV